jgi:hypothetical protein
MNRYDDRETYRGAANGIDPYGGMSSYAGSRHQGRDESSFAQSERDDWDRSWDRGERWGRGRSTYGGGYGYGASPSYGGYGYGEERWGSPYQSYYGREGTHGYGGQGYGGYEGGWERDRSRGSWGRDEDREAWARRWREDERGLGERIADFFRRELGMEERDRDRERWRERERRATWGREHEEPSMLERVKGAFTGRGPKGWRRSDERIREDVCERLAYHPTIDATDIEIVVKDGEVTLSGTVDERRAKRLAEEVVEDVRGVVDVHNQLRVRPQASGMATAGGNVGATTSQPTMSTSTTTRR